MSEYQYYEFRALDQPLSGQQRQELRKLSSRAQISATRFVNTYNFGDFRGDVDQVMERYFDVHLYRANWGTRQVILRWPRTLLDPGAVAPYAPGQSARAWATETHVLLALTSTDEEGDWDLYDDDREDGEAGILAELLPVRDEVAAGDPRALYVGWLLAVQSGEVDDEVLEPPVPPGLATSSEALQTLTRFLRLDAELLAAAAEASAPLDPGVDPAQLGAWIAALPPAEKDALLAQVVTGPSDAVALALRSRFRRAMAPGHRSDGAPRTVGALLAAAERRRQARERAAAQRAAREAERRARAEAEAMERRLRALALRGEAAWADVEARIQTKRPGEYQTARDLLRDLQTLAARDGREAEFARRLAQLRERHARKLSLLVILKDLDLP